MIGTEKMIKKILLSGMVGLTMTGQAETITIDSVRYAGPYKVMVPVMIDQVNVKSEPFDAKQILKYDLNYNVMQDGQLMSTQNLPKAKSDYALNLAGFVVENQRFAKAEIEIKGTENYICYVDGKEIKDGKVKLTPGTHGVTVKYLTQQKEDVKLQLSVKADKENVLTLKQDTKRIYTLYDVLHNIRFADAQLSPNGKYLTTSYVVNQEGGTTEHLTKVTALKTGIVVAERKEHLQWMPKSNLIYYTRKGVHSRELVTIDPETGKENILAKQLPEGSFRIAPSEDYLVYTLSQEGSKEKDNIYEVVHPEDRQPGWRTRTYIAKYDLASGLMQRLTYGYHNSWAADISADGRYILAMSSDNLLTQRPTAVFSVFKIDLQTMESEMLIEKDGFIANAGFSADAKSIFVTGSAEALGGIGNGVEKGKYPNMFEYQLFTMNLENKEVKAITRDFAPSVKQVKWNKKDNKIYFTAEDRDYVRMYRYDTSSEKFETIGTSEEIVKHFCTADHAETLVYFGQSASNSDRLYQIATGKLKEQLVEDLSKENLKDIELGECQAWNFKSSRGDTIYGRYYLPPHFDTNQKYPMIVNYYGGCSPVERTFEGRYPLHAYAALGYVVYVVEPSGASGFGQEFGSRHVNTAGNGPAQDIIEGTKQFCKEHEFVDPHKIGCIGASYGGFMTQYLQTQTDIFAAAISHAGISDHTSYWGEGYWGYSYSEVSMANSYPWSHRELYVDQSPLFNAEKVNTPILFLHGDKDTNVPVGESIQMYTALKLLGKETAMVLVKGEDHHIKNYANRIDWEHTIYAWFAKWLQNDDTWWNEKYPKKSL